MKDETYTGPNLGEVTIGAVDDEAEPNLSVSTATKKDGQII